MNTIAFNRAMAERQAEMLCRYRFMHDHALEKAFVWFSAEIARLRRPDDDFKPIHFHDIDAGPSVVARWRDLLCREREDPYRGECIQASRSNAEDAEEGRRVAAWGRYRVTLPALLQALDDAYPRGDYLAYLDLTEADLVPIVPAGQPDDVPAGFSLELERKIQTAYQRWKDTPPARRLEVSTMMAAKRVKAEQAAREQRIAALEHRIADLEVAIASLLDQKELIEEP